MTTYLSDPQLILRLPRLARIFTTVRRETPRARNIAIENRCRQRSIDPRRIRVKSKNLPRFLSRSGRRAMGWAKNVY